MTDTTQDPVEATEDDLLAEVIEKASVGVSGFGADRGLFILFSFVVTALSGAAVYGFLSVLVRGETMAKNLVAGIGDGYTRTVPQLDASARQSVVAAGYFGVVVVWALVAMALIHFQETIIAETLLEPRHRQVVAVFAFGLLPFLLLHNARNAFRAVRAIRMATLVSQLFRPAALLTGAVVGTLVIANRDPVTVLWTSVVVVTAVGAIVASALVVGRFGVTFRRQTAAFRRFVRYVFVASGVATLELVQRRAVFVVMAVFLEPVAAGLFSLSVVFGQLVRWPLAGVNTVFPPIVAQVYDSNRQTRLRTLYERTARLATVAATPVVLVLVPYRVELLALFSPLYTETAIVLSFAVLGQYLATAAGSVGLVLLMTDNELASLGLQLLNVAVAVPVLVVLTVRAGVVGLGAAYLIAIAFNNTTECLLLYHREGVTPVSRRQLLAFGTGVVAVGLTTAATSRVSVVVSVGVVALAILGYLALAWGRLLSEADRRAVTTALGRLN